MSIVTPIVLIFWLILYFQEKSPIYYVIISTTRLSTCLNNWEVKRYSTLKIFCNYFVDSLPIKREEKIIRKVQVFLVPEVLYFLVPVVLFSCL